VERKKERSKRTTLMDYLNTDGKTTSFRKQLRKFAKHQKGARGGSRSKKMERLTPGKQVKQVKRPRRKSKRRAQKKVRHLGAVFQTKAPPRAGEKKFGGRWKKGRKNVVRGIQGKFVV